MTSSARKLISIIVPVYNEQEVLPIFFERLQKAVAPARERYDIEFIFTNNCSTDRTRELILGWRESDPNIHLITLTRNFGYVASVLSGLTHARGDAVINIDSDGEDPPELIARFIEGWEEGYDVVYGLRDKRAEPDILVKGRKAFYRFTRLIADNDFILDMAEFLLMTRRVRDEVIKIANSFPFIRNDIAYVGFSRKGIPYTREPRIAGQTHYNALSLFAGAVAFILTASTFPLRVVGYVGVPLLLVNMICLLAGLVSPWGPGASGALAIANQSLLVYAVIFLSIYMARIYKNGMMRPTFIIDWERTTVSPRGREAPTSGGV
ncbi:Glycosyl transferase family 2 [Paramagnetospirillum magnetotacticum MS-1]|uniref:Glycosyl transferase family 2 n=1 Tax=Paramagnetospirillum magnetotacticum MS-1 TaxID=272627 RepID=A0A0C2UY76_PARME|nr:glycosyltransferase family 2 protein [Paramagnetospirillum magnetotacticum]KIL97761.1 Glycosyl transferase family 2 [Paramagnetospirillum magnetotacticum MS-1]